MSMKATVRSSSRTSVAGISPATILQNRQSLGIGRTVLARAQLARPPQRVRGRGDRTREAVLLELGEQLAELAPGR